MPSPANNSTAKRQGFWPAIVRTLLVEVLLLVALSGAIVAYLNWSSNAAWSEFVAASKQAAPGPTTPIQTGKGQAPCVRRV